MRATQFLFIIWNHPIEALRRDWNPDDTSIYRRLSSHDLGVIKRPTFVEFLERPWPPRLSAGGVASAGSGPTIRTLKFAIWQEVFFVRFFM